MLALICAGLLIPFLRGGLRSAVILAAPLLSLWLIWQVQDGVALSLPFLDQTLQLVSGSKLGRLFATVFSLAAFAGGLFALNQPSRLEVPVAFVYAGSAIGVTFAGDLLTLFIFWEVMAISTLVIWSNGAASRKAAMRYAMMHFLGGVILMAGVAGEAMQTGSLVFGAMDISTWPRKLIFAGFLINAAAFPVSAWAPDAYAKASWSGTVFLSAFTTKTAVFVLMVGFPGTEILIPIGLAMMFYGILWAALENDMRRLLAYFTVNQVGFMVMAIGIGTETALNGAAAHAFAHILYKGLLLMTAGSVLYMTGKNRMSDLGGLYRTMPVTTVSAVIGGLAISAFPLTSGFVPKSLMSGAVGEAQLAVAWFLLTAASAGVFVFAGLRYQWFTFFDRDSDRHPADPPWNMKAAMLLGVAFGIGLGVAPGALYPLLPFAVDYAPYTPGNVVPQLALLLFAGLAFFLMRDWVRPKAMITLDTDWLWRRMGAAVGEAAIRFAERLWALLFGAICILTWRFTGRLSRHHGPDGLLGRTWPTGTMAFWTTAVLAAFVLLG
jgi:multicomponent Na+:H+ antiporter subunit D